MSLTVVRENTHFGNKQVVLGTLTFDSSYAEGGLSIENFGIHAVQYCHIESKDGYRFEYDHINKKVKAFHPKAVPPLRYEEHHVMDSDYKVTLDYPAAYIQNVAKVGQSIPMRSTGVTPGANQCALTAQMAWGEDTELLFDSGGTSGGTLLVNGTFTTGSTGWTGTDLDAWTFADNALAKDGAGTGTAVEDAFAAVIGHTYEVTITITEMTVATGGLIISVGGAVGDAITAAGTYTQRFVATTTDGIALTPGNTALRCVVDNCSLIDCDVYVSYVTQAWREVWDNLVQDEEITLKTGANTLDSGNKIACLMYIDQTEATATRIIPIDEDDTAASGEAEVAFNAESSQLTVHSAQNGKDAKITYLKVPTSGFLLDRLFHNEGATKAGDDPYTNTFDYPILIWGYSGCVPINGGTTLGIIRYEDTPATGEAVIDWFGLGARGAAAPAVGTQVGCKDDVTATGAGIWGLPYEIPAVSIMPKMVEVEAGTDLSAIVTKFVMIGD